MITIGMREVREEHRTEDDAPGNTCPWDFERRMARMMFVIDSFIEQEDCFQSRFNLDRYVIQIFL